MRIHWFITQLAVLVLALAAASPALAVELKSSDITQDGKRVTLHLRFSAAVKYELIAHYAKNQVILHVDGLQLSKQQLKTGIAVKGNLKEAVNGIALEQPKEQAYGEIRLQLEKGSNPGDAQIIPRDSVIDIQFIVSTSAEGQPLAASKPTVTKPAGDEPADQANGWTPPIVTDEPLTTLTGQRFDAPLTIGVSTGDDPVLVTDEPEAGHHEPDDASSASAPAAEEPQAGSGEFIPEASATEQQPSQEQVPLDRPFTAEELAAFSGIGKEEAGDAQDVAGMPQTAAATTATVAAPPTDSTDGANPMVGADANETSVLHDSQPPSPALSRNLPPLQAVADPRPDFQAQPSYRQRDLGSVAVNQREYRNLPFREAILDLVAGTGFNVVVGPGIDNETVYLNFKQQELSLKSALETLCTVYELAYSVTDDAITITQQ